MTDFTAAVLASIRLAQLASQVFYALALTTWRYPPNCAISNGTSYDFIVIGGGSAGSILGNRLSANSSYNVLVIEAGGYAPLESEMPAMFALLPTSVFDYNMTSVNDNRTGQQLLDNVQQLVVGKMLGGCGGVDHMMHMHGCKKDYDDWASIIGSESCTESPPSILPRFYLTSCIKKQETLMDPELLDTDYANFHGTSGPIKIARQISSTNKVVLDSATEMGYEVLPDLTSDECRLGITEPLYEIYDGVRQSNAISYLGGTLSRKNLCVSLYTTAVKILIEDGVAVGVRAIDNDGNIYEVYAKKEVIVSAGGINSPKILMNSGIGPKAHLEENNIDVVADLPVGENYQDQPSLGLVYLLDNYTASDAPVNPYVFPAPTTVLLGSANRSQSYADYVAINFVLPNNSTTLLQLCGSVVKYKNDICNKWYEASANRSIFFAVIGLTSPKSRGSVKLQSSDYNDKPLVYPNFYTDEQGADLALMAKSLADFDKVTSTKYFQGVNATLVNPGVCLDATTDDEFWECYSLAMSFGMWHYVGTCAMPDVVDKNLYVKNVQNLRVIDASAMPTEVRGKPRSAVNMLAEFGSDLILKQWNITVEK